MAGFYIGLGPLVSWGTATFRAGSTKLLPFTLALAEDSAPVPGALLPVDRAGTGVVPLQSPTLTWEWLLRDLTLPGNEMQAGLDALLALWQTVGGGGVSGQTQLLTVSKRGGGTYTGQARLVTIAETEGQSNHKRIDLTFYLPGGMS